MVSAADDGDALGALIPDELEACDWLLLETSRTWFVI